MSDWNDCGQAFYTIGKNVTDALKATPEVAEEAGKIAFDESTVELVAENVDFLQIFKKYLPAISVGLTALGELIR